MLVLLGALPTALTIGMIGISVAPPIANAYAEATRGAERRAKAGVAAKLLSQLRDPTYAEVATPFFPETILVTEVERGILDAITISTVNDHVEFLAALWAAQADRELA